MKFAIMQPYFMLYIGYFAFKKEFINHCKRCTMTKLLFLTSIGINNLRDLYQVLSDHKVKYNHYKEILGQNSEISCRKNTINCNCSYYPTIFKDEDLALKVAAALDAENIFLRRYFYPSANTFFIDTLGSNAKIRRHCKSYSLPAVACKDDDSGY